MFDKFFEFLRLWSVGKILVTLSLLTIIFREWPYPEAINYIIGIGVFHELFDLSHNRVSDPSRPITKIQAFMFNIFMVISILSIVGIVLQLLWK
ncbi:hypothetical protein K9N08_01905 [Candidatus Gracilibacteria bacterium]|nr:hypothetical protein [Candidatus Gracilibacteria bacterium]